MTPRDLLALDDLPAATIQRILERAQALALAWAERRMPNSLEGRRVALIVNDDGWRNTTAFDLGISALGGTCVHAPMRLDRREDVPDLAAYLDNWFDAIISRTPELASLRALADAARAPVVNARTKQNHPCEVLGDLAFHLHCGTARDDIVVAVVAPAANILGSWIEAAAALPLRVIQIYPEPWHAEVGTRFHAVSDMRALAEADVIVTDCWPSDADPEVLLPYQVTAEVLDRLRPNVAFLPCPPVRRGQEVSADAMLHPACRVIEAKAFLLHAQNAALEWVFGRL